VGSNEFVRLEDRLAGVPFRKLCLTSKARMVEGDWFKCLDILIGIPEIPCRTNSMQDTLGT